MSYSQPVLPWALGQDYPHWSDRLHDGTSVAIRPITAADVEKERKFIVSLSPESRRFRFLGQIGKPSDDLPTLLTNVDYTRDAAFAAIATNDIEGRFVGVGRYNVAPDGSGCECAVAVLDAWQHRGLGTVLMKHLVDVARARGICSMYSLDAADNLAMAELAHFLGFERRLDRADPSTAVHSFWLGSCTDD